MCCRAARVHPSLVLDIEVTADDPNPRIRLDPNCVKRVAFVLATCTDPRGLAAFGIDFARDGAPSDQHSYWAPARSMDGRTLPPASMVLPPGLHRAEEYPSPFRGIVIGDPDRRQEVVIRDLRGDLPYTVSLTFFAEVEEPKTAPVAEGKGKA